MAIPSKLLAVATLALATCLALSGPAAAKRNPKTTYYVSLGDSLSVGIQPGPRDNPGQKATSVPTSTGYSDQLYAKAKRLFPGLKLVKAGCSGATTANMLRGGADVSGIVGCDQRQPRYAGTSVRTSQMVYAEKFMRKHRRHMAFVTVSIGNNDLDACLAPNGVDLACVMAGQQSISRDVGEIGRRLRLAAGPKVPVIGTTFYDPYLGLYLRGGDLAAVAEASQALAKSINEQTLMPAWRKSGIRSARIDDAFGTYIPFSQTVNDATLGTVPEAVAKVCHYTWFCAPPPAGPNIHANKAGYRVIANAFFAQLKAAA
jgi:lysophospholipase L1-like esterase